jgi:hypothetical protein
MEHLFFPFAVGFGGLAVAGGLASIAYPLFVVWMIVDGVLRVDAEYPGTEPNRKVLWVVAMVLLHPVAIAYLFAVLLKVKRGSATTASVQAPAA